ncbi:MAG: (d)CMP kinase [Proteobacteria bacterium]|nr:(d)CMP kinase [Pseudomonadota bacterium]
MHLEVVGTSIKKRPLPIVAIDGPAGAGKSTVARLLAYQLNFILVDTGALYRCLAMQALERNISLNDEKALSDLCSNLSFQFASLEKHRVTHTQGLSIPKLQVYCNGVDVTDSIRSPELGIAASNVSKLPLVRKALLEVQRSFGDKGGIVMEGRDIGTVIFPDAELKFFLTASLESRGSRRLEELKGLGIEKALEQVMKETSMRDEQDRNRAIAPLKQAENAILIDSTDKTLEDVVSQMSKLVRDYLKK